MISDGPFRRAAAPEVATGDILLRSAAETIDQGSQAAAGWDNEARTVPGCVDNSKVHRQCATPDGHEQTPLGLGSILLIARESPMPCTMPTLTVAIHRDIKPANILLEDGRVVVDFGIAWRSAASRDADRDRSALGPCT
jgi:serine/threonine protein kinase